MTPIQWRDHDAWRNAGSHSRVDDHAAVWRPRLCALRNPRSLHSLRFLTSIRGNVPEREMAHWSGPVTELPPVRRPDRPVTHPICCNVGENAAVKIIDVEIMAGAFDLNPQPA